MPKNFNEWTLFFLDCDQFKTIGGWRTPVVIDNALGFPDAIAKASVRHAIPDGTYTIFTTHSGDDGTGMLVEVTITVPKPIVNVTYRSLSA